MKCRYLFSGISKKKMSKCHLLKFLSIVLRVNSVSEWFHSLCKTALWPASEKTFSGFFFFSSE